MEKRFEETFLYLRKCTHLHFCKCTCLHFSYLFLAVNCPEKSSTVNLPYFSITLDDLDSAELETPNTFEEKMNKGIFNRKNIFLYNFCILYICGS